MLNKKVQTKLLEQVKHEWESEFYYMAMMAWCYNNDYDGFGKWFFNQANEERNHGLRIISFIADVGGEIEIPSVKVPSADFKDLEDIFARQLKHEEKVTKLVHELVDLSIKENDHSTNTFLQWFVREQIEEEATSRHLLAKVKRAQGSPGALLMLESELAGQRPEALPAAIEDAD